MKSQLSRYLRAFRMVRGISAAEAAKAADISLSTWTQYESGATPGILGLIKLTEYLGCDQDKLKRLVDTPCEEHFFDQVAKAAVEQLFSTL